MAQIENHRILSALMTATMTTAQSRIRSELGNFPSGPTKFTVIHRRPVFTLSPPLGKAEATGSDAEKPEEEKKQDKILLPNTMCSFVRHPVVEHSESKSSPPAEELKPALVEKTFDVEVVKTESISSSSIPSKPRMKRSLSADNLDIFAPMPAKRPFPVRIWFNQKPGPRLPVATAHWQDSPLHDTVAFVYTKLLEASQARRYLQLQSKPRKYLHLTGGGMQSVAQPVPQPRKNDHMTLPPMTVMFLPPARPQKKQALPSTPSTSSSSSMHHVVNSLPPPPPLISLALTRIKIEPPEMPEVRSCTPPQQEQPLELCKRRKHSNDSGGGLLENNNISQIVQRSSSPLNLVINSSSSDRFKRKIALPPINLHGIHEAVDLASPSPTTAAFNRMTLLSPTSPPEVSDLFHRRLILVLQVLLGNRRLVNLGHPQASVEDILARILRRAGIVPARSVDVRTNWLKFLRLCVKNEEAWKREGWDHKSPDAILEEIYMQGNSFLMTHFFHFILISYIFFVCVMIDVIPLLRKTETVPIINKYLQKEEGLKQSVP